MENRVGYDLAGTLETLNLACALNFRTGSRILWPPTSSGSTSLLPNRAAVMRALPTASLQVFSMAIAVLCPFIVSC